MISMTGYGYSEFQNEQMNCSLEIKSYNNRYLDMNINMPTFLGPLEAWLRQTLGQSINRGRVELYLKIREKEEDLQVQIDYSAAEAFYNGLVQLNKRIGLKEEIKLEQIMHLEGVIKIDKKRDIDKYRSVIGTLLEDALDQLKKARETEGKHTREDIFKQLNVVQQFKDRVAELAPQVEEETTRMLKEKFAEVLGDEVEESRVLNEVASYLVRYDINEELSRLDAHLTSFRDLCEHNDPLGKKLDFLCQEMNREVNTIGSKSPQVDVHRLVVDAKDAMEKIREQLRNVE